MNAIESERLFDVSLKCDLGNIHLISLITVDALKMTIALNSGVKQPSK